MPEPEKSQDEPTLFDLNRWINSEEDRKRAMGILAPSSDEEMELRRPIITKVSGKAPDMYRAFQAAFHIEMLRARMENRHIDWDGFLAVPNILELSMSQGGWRAKQIEEMHKMTPKAPQRRTLIDAFMGRKS